MSVDTPEQLEGLRRAGRVVAETIAAVRRAAVPGVSTAELDAVAQAVFERHGARSGPILTYGYPGSICLSVDDEIVHGIPGPRTLRDGQLLTIDVAAELDGFHADAATTVAIGTPSHAADRLLASGRRALAAGIEAAQPGATLRDVGAAVEEATEADGFRVARELTGHGIGHAMHEPPTVYNWPAPAEDASLELTEGLVFTIEPMITAGTPRFAAASDGWTIRSLDGALSTHEEHTVMVRRGGALVLTDQGASS
jgi:methionyl aminopeptidase